MGGQTVVCMEALPGMRMLGSRRTLLNQREKNMSALRDLHDDDDGDDGMVHGVLDFSMKRSSEGQVEKNLLHLYSGPWPRQFKWSGKVRSFS